MSKVVFVKVGHFVYKKGLLYRPIDPYPFILCILATLISFSMQYTGQPMPSTTTQ